MLTETIVNETICYNPATGEEIGRSKLHTISDLQKFVEEGREAQKKWSRLSIQQRTKSVLKIRDFIVANTDYIADVINKDNGKTKFDALATEILPAAMAISYYCRKAKTFLKDKKLSAGNIFLVNKRSKIIRVPYGVVGIISPWNYPFGIPFSEVIIALLSGNSVILKTASETQQVGLILKEAFDYAKLPDGLFNYVNLPGSIAGEAFLDAGINKISFTGSVQIGKYLMEKSAKYLTPITLELGGNDAMIVCEDADIYRAANGAVWAGFQSTGQSCGGVERIYIHEKIYDQFISILKEKVSNLNVNIGSNLDSDMGCMTKQSQIDIVKKHIDDAIQKGAKIFAESKIPENNRYKNFLPAVVLTDVNHNMLVMQDETFGPVVGVMKFKDIDEAIKLANDSCLGLTGSVWSKNQSNAEKIARQIQAGIVTINDHLISHGLAETPWGGFKQSGIGRTHGKYGFDEMTQPMVIVKDSLSFTKKQLWWHPYSDKVYNGIKGLLNFMYGNKLNFRIKGLKDLLVIVPRLFQR